MKALSLASIFAFVSCLCLLEAQDHNPTTAATTNQPTESVPATTASITSATSGSNDKSTQTASSVSVTATQSHETTKSDASNTGNVLSMSPNEAKTFKASEQMEINCSSTVVKGIAPCPVMYVGPEDNGKINFENRTVLGNTSCSMTWTVRALENSFKRRRVEVPVFCAVVGVQTTQLLFRFEKKGDGESCDEDMDCFYQDQLCENKICTCNQDTLSFEPEENKCLPVSSYDKHCDIDVQCTRKDSNTLCRDHICKCTDDHSYNDTSHTCVGSVSSSLWNPTVAVTIFSTAILTLLLSGQAL